jgi:hypothetical protein
VEDAYTDTREIGYADATSDWRELLFEVDMEPHLANLSDPNGWLRIRISTNNDANNDAEKRVFVDNFRVAVAKSTDVSKEGPPFQSAAPNSTFKISCPPARP